MLRRISDGVSIVMRSTASSVPVRIVQNPGSCGKLEFGLMTDSADGLCDGSTFRNRYDFCKREKGREDCLSGTPGWCFQ